MKPATIILAAGSSSRMGRSKQMLDICGEKLLLRTVKQVLNARPGAVVVVLGFDEAAHRRLLEDHPVDIVSNANWQRGMGSSLKAGLSHLLSKDPALDAVVVSVCDQPRLHSQNISGLIEKYQQTGKPIIASTYAGRPGVPVLFSKTYFERLMTLPDNEGAKKLMIQHPDDVLEVPFPGGEIDLDTMDDYETYLRSTDGK